MAEINDWEDIPSPASEITDWEDIKEVSKLESGARGLAQGASMGFSDEIVGGVEALWDKAVNGDEQSLKELYQKHRDESRAANKAASEANPVSYGAGQVGGAIGTAFVPGLGGANITKLGALGATQGLGSSEADLTEGDLSGAARDTAIGGATGLAIGGAGKAIGALGSKAGTGIKNVIDDVATAPMGQAGAQMGMVARGIELGGKLGGAVNKGFDAMGDMGRSATALLTGGASLGVNAGTKVLEKAPGISQKVAGYIAPSLESIIPKMGKFSKTLSDAAARGGTALAAASWVLQQTNPEYREMYQKLSSGEK